MIGVKSKEETLFNPRTLMEFKGFIVTMYLFLFKAIYQPHGVLKPGESKTFTFSFRSAETPGMYFEEWELLTDPQLLVALPLVYLSGIATLNDDEKSE